MAKTSGKKTSKKKPGTRTKSTAPKQAARTPAPGRETAPPFAKMHIWHFQAVRDVLFVGSVLAIFWAGYALRAVTVPLLVALLLAYLFEPIVERLSEWRNLGRARAVSALLAGGAVLIVVLLALLLPLAVGQTTRFVNEVRDGRLQSKVAHLDRFVPPRYREEFLRVVALLPGDFDVETLMAEQDADAEGGTESAADEEGSEPTTGGDETPIGNAAFDDEQLIELIDERVAATLHEQRAKEQTSASNLVQFASRGIDTMLRILGATIQIGLTAFLIPFYFFFFSLWYPHVVRFGRQLLPEKNRPRMLELLGKMDTVVAGFVRGRIVISVIMGIMLAVGWWIAGVPYAIVLGLVIGVFCAVPYLGGIGIPIAIGLLLFEQIGMPESERMGWFAILFWPTVVFVIVQVFEGYVLTPAIAGKATNLDPVTILVAVLAGGSVLGVYGMLLAIPAAACGKILFTDVLMPRVRAWTKGERKDPLPID